MKTGSSVSVTTDNRKTHIMLGKSPRTPFDMLNKNCEQRF